MSVNDETQMENSNTDALKIKMRCKKEPLPMKLRAFPRSFWQQPNKTAITSPGTVYYINHALTKEETASEKDGVGIGEEKLRVSEPNVDLLFSLFRNIEPTKQHVAIIRRGRPRKPKSESSKVIRDDDPYLTSNAAESFLPLLPMRSKLRYDLKSRITTDEKILAMLAAVEGSTNLLAPSNQNNYSQILSELVIKL